MRNSDYLDISICLLIQKIFENQFHFLCVIWMRYSWVLSCFGRYCSLVFSLFTFCNFVGSVFLSGYSACKYWKHLKINQSRLKRNHSETRNFKYDRCKASTFHLWRSFWSVLLCVCDFCFDLNCILPICYLFVCVKPIFFVRFKLRLHVFSART